MRNFLRVHGGLELDSQHLILIVTYECAQYAGVLDYTRSGSLASDTQYSLLGPLVSYYEKEGLIILSLVLIPCHRQT